MTNMDDYTPGYEMEDYAQQPEQVQEAPKPEYQPVSNAEMEALNTAVREIKHTVKSATKAFLRSDSCIVQQSLIDEQVRTLENSIPAAIKSALQVLSSQNDILSNARAYADSMTAKADKKAIDTVGSAKKEAEEIRAQTEEAEKKLEQIKQSGEALIQRYEQEANQNAMAIEQKARQHADQIIAAAERKAQELIREQEILRRAQQEAEELTRKTEDAMTQLQQQTFSFLNDAMKRTEQYVGSMAQNIHQQREELKRIQ